MLSEFKAHSLIRCLYPKLTYITTYSKSSLLMSESFILRATPSIKKYNIARFDVPTLPSFKACSQPVMMYREPEKLYEDDNNDKQEEIGYNPALRKRRRRRRKDSRTAGWIIEDKDSKTTFNGACEGGQASTYMLLIQNRHNNEFNVIPVEQWFRFKKPLAYRTLTLEEAEDLNNEKKRAVERWLMRHKLAGDEKPDTDLIHAPKLRTGAVTGNRVVPVKDSGDIFQVQEKVRPVARVKKPIHEGDPTGEDGGDFEEKFDDDESEAEIDGQDAANLSSDSEEDEMEKDANGQEKLTETGQAMKDLLKRAQNGEMEVVEKKDDAVSSEAEDEYTANDMEKIRRDLGGNIIWSNDTPNPNVQNDGAGANQNAGNVFAEGDEKGKGINSGTVIGHKRKAEDSKEENVGKREKAPVSAVAAAALNKLTEAGVQQELMRYGGRMRTKDLLRKLRKSIVTDDDRAMLKDILRTICDVETDAVDGRMLVLKSQFR